MSYDQNASKSKHPVIIAVANKAAEILHTAILPLWHKATAGEDITTADLKQLDTIVGILKDIQGHADASNEFADLTTEQLIEKCQTFAKVVS